MKSAVVKRKTATRAKETPAKQTSVRASKQVKSPAKRTLKRTVKSKAKRIVRSARASKAARASSGDAYAPSPEQAFWVNHGPICQSIEELREALRSMSDEQFQHHVNPNKNDFADWLVGVLQHNECAERIRRAKSRAGAMKVLVVCTC